MPHESNEPQEQPALTSDSSEFTQLFGKAAFPEKQDSALPFAPATPLAPAATHNSDSGFTAIFAPTQADLAAGSVPPRKPNLAEAPTQIFAALPSAEERGRVASAADETSLFSAAPAPHRVVEEKQAPSPSTPPPTSRTASEFTSVFQPMALPTAMPAPAPAVLDPAPGEFTQFFSAVSMRSNKEEQAGTAARPASSPLPVVPAARAQAAAPAPAAAAQSGEFTQLFQQQPASPPFATPQTPHLKQQMVNEQAHPGAFTQMFSQLPVADASPLPATTSPTPAQASGSSQPIFGTAAPRGTFTDIFSASAVPPAYERTAAAVPETFLGEPSPSFPAAPAAKSAAFPPAFSPPAAAVRPASGEFTQLMQSLERPASPASMPPQAPPVDAAFFAPAAGSAGESEYTRVLRSGGAGSSAGVPLATPTAGSAAKPGLALAPEPTAADLKDKPDPKKPKLLVIVLVAVNMLVLIALLVIGLVLLHRR